MALTTSTFPAFGGTVDNTSAATFIPEQWSSEVIAAYERALKMGPLTMRYSFGGKSKGDTIRVPKPVRGQAHQKVENQEVTIQQDTEGELVINIDRHFEYSREIEDITKVQALESLRRFYTQDAGYALARQIDDDLFRAGTGFGDGTLNMATPVSGTATGANWVNSNVFYNNGGTATAYAVDTVDDNDTFDASNTGDSFLRQMIRKMNDNDVPMDGRSLVIPPSMLQALQGIDRFVSSDFVSGRPVETGHVGNLYGVDVYVSSNCPVIEDATSNTAASTTADLRGAFLFHKDTIILAEQMGVRSQTDYNLNRLADLYVADTLYGVQAYRPESGFIIVTPDV